MDNSERIRLCNAALEACKNLLSAKAYDDIYDNINKYNEWGLGIELLIDILYEDDVPLSEAHFNKIEMAMMSTGLGKGDRMIMAQELLKKT